MPSLPLIRYLVFLLLTLLSQALLAADRQTIEQLLSEQNIRVAAIREQGVDVLPILASLYSEATNNRQKSRIAGVFYQLGWQSEKAYEVLMADIHTPDPELRLQVQWALGRVSSDDRVVKELLNNMRNDQNPLFRNKAACALASD